MVNSTVRQNQSIRPIERLRYDAGSLSLNLVATMGRRRSTQPVERLWNPTRLEEWLVAVGLRDGHHQWALSSDDLQAVRDLREALYQVALAAAVPSGALPAPEDLERINACASTPLPPPTLEWANPAVECGEGTRPPGRLPLKRGVAPDTGLPTILSAIARDAIETLTSEILLRTCEGELCGMLFVDTSQGGRRRWCSMGRCGNQSKVARHRRRHARGDHDHDHL
jgi:predicted RNA-binding Zn ribbon-like protein